jgi:uncharacterized membrane protein HdeD (DUF308 family)
MATANTPLEQVASKWWVPMLIGLLSVAAGILALAYQDITLLALGLILGIYILVFATFALMSAFEPGASTGHVVLRMIVGIVGILAGLVAIVRPGASVLALLIVLGLWFIVTGVGDLVRGIVEPGNRVISIVLGLIGIAAGIIVLGDPDIGLSTLAILAGIMFIVRGVFEIALGWELHRLHAT